MWSRKIFMMRYNEHMIEDSPPIFVIQKVIVCCVSVMSINSWLILIILFVKDVTRWLILLIRSYLSWEIRESFSHRTKYWRYYYLLYGLVANILIGIERWWDFFLFLYYKKIWVLLIVFLSTRKNSTCSQGIFLVVAFKTFSNNCHI